MRSTNFPRACCWAKSTGPVNASPIFYGSAERPVLHLPLNYRLQEVPWSGTALEQAIDAYLKLVPPHGWPNWLIGGHDKKRIVELIGQERARVAAMLLMTLPGTVLLYQGDDIGMKGIHVPSPQSRDPFERRVPGYGLNRDAERAPMPWNGGTNAGFTRGTPWLPLADDHRQRNVAVQRDDPTSLLALYRSLIRLRAAHPVLTWGAFASAYRSDAVFAYVRRDERESVLVLLNLGPDEQTCPLPDGVRARLLLSTGLDRGDAQLDGTASLRAHEGLMLLQN